MDQGQNYDPLSICWRASIPSVSMLVESSSLPCPVSLGATGFCFSYGFWISYVWKAVVGRAYDNPHHGSSGHCYRILRFLSYVYVGPHVTRRTLGMCTDPRYFKLFVSGLKYQHSNLFELDRSRFEQSNSSDSSNNSDNSNSSDRLNSSDSSDSSDHSRRSKQQNRWLRLTENSK